MKDSRRFILIGLIVLAFAGLLIYKLAVPRAGGPSNTAPQKIAVQEEASHPGPTGVQDSGTQAAASQSQARADASGEANGQQITSETDQNPPRAETSEPGSKSQPEVRPVWLLFRSSTCVPCIEMQKTMDALHPEFKGKVDFITVDVNDPNNRDTVLRFQVRYIPVTYLFDRNKTTYFHYVGALPVQDMRNKLQSLVEVK